MAQHISLFQNNSSGKDAVTANPVQSRDTYFVAKKGSQKPGHNVLINKGSWSSYSAAFPHANFIYTGQFAYCFWDTGESQIAGVTAQEHLAVPASRRAAAWPGHQRQRRTHHASPLTSRSH